MQLSDARLYNWVKEEKITIEEEDLSLTGIGTSGKEMEMDTRQMEILIMDLILKEEILEKIIKMQLN